MYSVPSLQFINLVRQVIELEKIQLFSALAGRNMELQAYIADQEVLLSNEKTSVQVTPQRWYPV